MYIREMNWIREGGVVFDMKRINVLIVEDQYEDMEYCASMIEELSENIVLHKCGTGKKAVNIISEHSIDAVFIDVILPDVNGFELAGMIRKTENYRFVPIVFITGENRNYVEVHKRYHHYEYIRKPFTSTEFKNRVSPLISGLILEKKECGGADSARKHMILVETSMKKAIRPYDNVLFAEFYQRKVCLHTDKEIYSGIRMGLKEFIGYVNRSSFKQTYKSFAANTERIQSIEREGRSLWTIHFDNGTGGCLLGKTFYEDIVRTFVERSEKSNG